jgi:hypothetical protein
MKNLIILVTIINCTALFGQDRIFTYTYQSGVLNKGQKELEVWTTMHNGRADYYRAFDHRLEFEVGLGGKIQTAFYLNYGYSKGVTESNGVQQLNTNTEYSFSNEWKFKLTDPVADFLGSALYFEYTLSPSATELEGKIILDKQKGKILQALNVTGEYEFFKDFISEGNKINTGSDQELKIEFNYALSYKIKEGLSIGLELFNENQFSGSMELEYSLLSLGPVLSYNINSFWINLTVMPQITNLKGKGLELTENEKLQTRLVFSYAF